MSVRIRLRRMGAKKRAFYRFVATDARSPRDGRFREILGYYNPIETPAKIVLKEERIYYWLKQGAIPSETVNSLFRQIGLISKWEKIKKGEDVSSVELQQVITERKKKRKTKKRVVKAEAVEEKVEEGKEKAEAKPESKEKEEVKAETEAKPETKVPDKGEEEKKKETKETVPETKKSEKEEKEKKPESEGKKSEVKEPQSKTKDSAEGKS